MTAPFARPGSLDVTWHAGWPSAKHDPAPEIQVHTYEPDTIILRQNRSVHYEAPFMFLLFGDERALLVDTGATEQEEYFPLRRTVDALVAERLARHPRPGYGLLVAHTHAHGDHRAGDPQFADRPDTTVVGTALAEVTAFYRLPDWPEGRAEVDLGGRVVDVIPAPGHHETSVAFYDRATGLLLTGDTLYPGRLYIQDWPEFVSTVDRLLGFCADRPVSHVLGCHVEMSSAPGRDYPIGTTYQPDEPALQLTVGHLHALRRALADIDGRPGAHPCDDFVVFHLTGEETVADLNLYNLGRRPTTGPG